MRTPANQRCEIKFISSEIEYHRLRHWIHYHPACFFREYPSRQVNNIYFDTFNFNSYCENLSGSSSRAKVRYRWYGESLQPLKGAVEIKEKRNHFSWKIIYKVNEPLEKVWDDWGELQREITSHLPASGRTWLRSHPMAILINRYKRDYFRCKDGDIRITLDTRLSVYDQMRKPAPNYIVKSNYPEIVVLEVKFPRNSKPLASQILKNIPVRVSRHSKYIASLSSISLV